MVEHIGLFQQRKIVSHQSFSKKYHDIFLGYNHIEKIHLGWNVGSHFWILWIFLGSVKRTRPNSSDPSPGARPKKRQRRKYND
jgi:hypothetical protein